MEVQGFGGSLVGKTIWVHGEEWIPWEFLQKIACRFLIHDSTTSLLFTDTWDYAIVPRTAKDWSCVATILKAISASSSVLVAWTISVPPNFVRFVEQLPVTRLMLSSEEPVLPVDAVFGTPTAAFRGLCERMPPCRNHGTYTPPSSDAWGDLTRTLSEGGMSVMLTDVGESAWTLFWYKPSDSRDATDAKERASMLLSAAQRALC